MFLDRFGFSEVFPVEEDDELPAGPDDDGSGVVFLRSSGIGRMKMVWILF